MGISAPAAVILMQLALLSVASGSGLFTTSPREMHQRLKQIETVLAAHPPELSKPRRNEPAQGAAHRQQPRHRHQRTTTQLDGSSLASSWPWPSSSAGIIKERVNAGLAATKARGVQLGRPATINGRAAEIEKLKAKGLGLRAIARQLKMPPSSVHKALRVAA